MKNCDLKLKNHSTMSDIIIRLVLFLFNFTSLILIVRYEKYFSAWLFYCVIILSCAMLIMSTLLVNTKSAIYKLLLVFNLLYGLVLVCYLIFVASGLFDSVNSVEELRNVIASTGVWGIVILFLLTVFQVVVLPLPAAVTILIGVFLYGATVSFLISSLGTVVGSVVCYFVGRKLGYRAVEWIAGKENTEKYTKIIAERGKIPFIVMMLFPFFPDDILCMVAGLTKMPFKFFILVVLLARPVTIAFFSYFGSGEIIPFSGWGIPVWMALIATVLFLLYLINYLIKNKKEK